MSQFVRIEPLDLVVYGQVQYAFSVTSLPGEVLPYDRAVVETALQRSVAMQAEITPVKNAIKIRSAKLEELGKVLANITPIILELQLKETKLTDDTKHDIGYISGGDGWLPAWRYLEKYGITIDGTKISSKFSSFTYAELQKLQQNVKLEIDRENSDVERDTSSLQSYIQKVDSAYSLIGKLQKKIDGTAGRTIQQIGGL